MRQELRNLLAAGAVYAAFAVYLYLPHLADFYSVRGGRFLIPVNVCLAAVGCFLLSRRWLRSFCDSLFAGAVYGFGPFMLGLAEFHPAAGFVVALVPWLFCPAAFVAKGKWRAFAIPFCMIPFAVIILLFALFSHLRLFPVPVQADISVETLVGLIAPLAMVNRPTILVGFYHIPIAPMLAGFLMLLSFRRLGIVLIFAAGLILGIFRLVPNVSPIMWFSIPLLCCSVLVGVGLMALANASYTDRVRVLATALVMAVLAVLSLLLTVKCLKIFAGLGGKYANGFLYTAQMYLAGAVALTILFFMIRAKVRAIRLRKLILYCALVMDVVLGAAIMTDAVI